MTDDIKKELEVQEKIKKAEEIVAQYERLKSLGIDIKSDPNYAAAVNYLNSHKIPTKDLLDPKENTIDANRKRLKEQKDRIDAIDTEIQALMNNRARYQAIIATAPDDVKTFCTEKVAAIDAEIIEKRKEQFQIRQELKKLTGTENGTVRAGSVFRQHEDNLKFEKEKKEAVFIIADDLFKIETKERQLLVETDKTKRADLEKEISDLKKEISDLKEKYGISDKLTEIKNKELTTEEKEAAEAKRNELIEKNNERAEELRAKYSDAEKEQEEAPKKKVSKIKQAGSKLKNAIKKHGKKILGGVAGVAATAGLVALTTLIPGGLPVVVAIAGGAWAYKKVSAGKKGA